MTDRTNENGHHASDTQVSVAIAEIRELYRQRRYVIDTQKRINQATLALVRSAFGFRIDADAKERNAISKAAADFIKGVEAGQARDDDQSSTAHFLAPYIVHAAASREPFDTHRKNIEKRCAVLVQTLPVWPWAESIRGINTGSVAAVICECGDLSNYANPGKVWKRMGLAPFTGGKDGDTKAGSTWKMKGGLSAAEWTDYGYSPRRMSVAYCIAEALVKSNQDGDYRVLYINRKKYELDRDPEMKPIQAHRRAMRYMVKRWLRDLWKEWVAMNGCYPLEAPLTRAVSAAA